MVVQHKAVCSSLNLKSEDHTYNGWSNYETWLVNLWLDNEPYTQEEVERIAKMKGELYQKIEAMEELVDSIILPTVGSGLSQDLLTAAVDQIDYREIVLAHPASDWA
tara:strand:- start:6010 stop:6330 length:321 start_codon:yes stop_codon:yes gene_type:complete